MGKKIVKTLGPGRHLTRTEARKAARLVVQKGETISGAMRAVGYAETTAGHNQKILTRNPVFQEEVSTLKAQIARACEQNNVSVDRLVKKVSDGLDAKKPMNGTGGMMLKFDQGEASEFGHAMPMIPDHDAQVKWWDRAAQLIGIKKDDEGAGTVINIAQFFQLVQKSESERGLREVAG